MSPIVKPSIAAGPWCIFTQLDSTSLDEHGQSDEGGDGFTLSVMLTEQPNSTFPCAAHSSQDPDAVVLKKGHERQDHGTPTTVVWCRTHILPLSPLTETNSVPPSVLGRGIHTSMVVALRACLPAWYPPLWKNELLVVISHWIVWAAGF